MSKPVDFYQQALRDGTRFNHRQRISNALVGIVSGAGFETSSLLHFLSGDKETGIVSLVAGLIAFGVAKLVYGNRQDAQNEATVEGLQGSKRFEEGFIPEYAQEVTALRVLQEYSIGEQSLSEFFGFTQAESAIFSGYFASQVLKDWANNSRSIHMGDNPASDKEKLLATFSSEIEPDVFLHAGEQIEAATLELVRGTHPENFGTWSPEELRKAAEALAKPYELIAYTEFYHAQQAYFGTSLERSRSNTTGQPSSQTIQRRLEEFKQRQIAERRLQSTLEPIESSLERSKQQVLATAERVKNRHMGL